MIFILPPSTFRLAFRRGEEMKGRLVCVVLLVAASLQAGVRGAWCSAQQAAGAAGAAQKAAESKATPKAASALKRYAGRYELERGLIPVSTLDVTLEGDALWVKPSLLKKRRLIHKSKSVFIDEIEGARYVFNKDDEGRIVSLTFPFEGEQYTAQRVEIPPPSLTGNTTFKLKGYPDANIVALAGSFNNWNQSEIICGREADEWVCRVDLNPGFYTYKFIVDGNWLLDPANPDTVEDEAGNINSRIEVKEK